MENVMRSLPVKLTEAEKLDRGQLMAQELETVKRIEIELATAKAGFKSRLETAKGNISLYSTALAQGTEHREIECRQVPDRVEGIVRIVRTDTEEVVAVRPMTRAEVLAVMQERMPE